MTFLYDSTATVPLYINGKDFNLSASRMSKLLNGDKREAVRMGLWDKILDFFRSEKKVDALNELYTLIYQDQDAPIIDSSLSNDFISFQKIKEMALESHQHLFTVEETPHYIRFMIGTTRICDKHFHQLSSNDKSFLDIYQTEHVNARTEEVKDIFTACVQRRIDEDNDAADRTQQLYKDLPRSRYTIEDQSFSSQDGIPVEEKREALTAFLQDLTPDQQRSLNAVGTQIAAIELKNALGNVSPIHAFLGNPTPKYAMMFDRYSHSVLVNVAVEQLHTAPYFDDLRNAVENAVAKYPKLGLQATFSIAENGVIKCIDFHVASYSDGIESTQLMTDEPDQYAVLTYLKQFSRACDIQWSFATCNNLEKACDQQAQHDLWRDAFTRQIQSHPLEIQQKILTHLQGDFGSRLRGVLEFAAAKVGQHEEDKRAISSAYKYPCVFDEFVIALSTRLNVDESPLTPPIWIDDFNQLTTSEILALSLVGIKASTLAL